MNPLCMGLPHASTHAHAHAQGIGVRFNTNVTALAKTDTGIAATLTDGSVEEYDVVMFATGVSRLLSPPVSVQSPLCGVSCALRACLAHAWCRQLCIELECGASCLCCVVLPPARVPCGGESDAWVPSCSLLLATALCWHGAVSFAFLWLSTMWVRDGRGRAEGADLDAEL
jgi:hypothetical protein